MGRLLLSLISICLLVACEGELASDASSFKVDEVPGCSSNGNAGNQNPHCASPTPTPTPTPAPAATPSYSTLNSQRYWHTATLLQDGRVLVAGGETFPTTISSEIYDPSTNSWTVGPQMVRPRQQANAVLLPDGRVLIVGGMISGAVSGDVREIEVYDPVSNSFSLVASLSRPRYLSSVTLLADGKVLILGGGNTVTLSDADDGEIFDPATNTLRPYGGRMKAGRHGHTTRQLPDGWVIVTGGFSNGWPVGTIEVGRMVGVPEAFLETNPLWTPRAGHTTCLLPNGETVTAGGFDFNSIPVGTLRALSSIELNPNGALSYSTTPLPTPLYATGFVQRANGACLMTGGRWTSNQAPTNLILELDNTAYDYTQSAYLSRGYHQIGTIRDPRSDHTATLLQDGSLLVVGGWTWNFPGSTASVERIPLSQ